MTHTTSGIESQPESKGVFSLWLKGITIIDHETQRPLTITKATLHGLDGGDPQLIQFLCKELRRSRSDYLDTI